MVSTERSILMSSFLSNKSVYVKYIMNDMNELKGTSIFRSGLRVMIRPNGHFQVNNVYFIYYKSDENVIHP